MVTQLYIQTLQVRIDFTEHSLHNITECIRVDALGVLSIQ